MGTNVFDPASWDEAATKIEAVRGTVNDQVRPVVQRTPLDFVSASPVDQAVHMAGLYPRNKEIAALLVTVGKRLDDEAAAARQTAKDYRKTKRDTTEQARAVGQMIAQAE